jgi:phosphoribosyl 1,2-cyclic phosphodiesterase
MKIFPLSSGSKGNSTLIKSEKTNILIDSGMSMKKTAERLSEFGEKLDDVSAIFLTHEHTDHISGAGVLARKYRMPVYGTSGTIAASRKKGIFNKNEDIKIITNPVISHFDMEIEAISVSHDASEPVAYKISSNKKSFGIITDLGISTHLIKQKMNNLDGYILEHNHDEHMLKMNPQYPWELKQRIMSNKGHLSNHDGAKLFKEISGEKTKIVYLAHLSEENNDPHLAMDTFEEINSTSIRKTIAKQHYVTEDFEI